MNGRKRDCEYMKCIEEEEEKEQSENEWKKCWQRKKKWAECFRKENLCLWSCVYIELRRINYVAFTFHLHHVNAREFTFYDNRLSKILFDIISTRESRVVVYIVVCPTVDIVVNCPLPEISLWTHFKWISLITALSVAYVCATIIFQSEPFYNLVYTMFADFLDVEVCRKF